MIVVKLTGGLGNQLFQYAVGRKLAQVHKTNLKLDITFFQTYKLHTYSIWPFNIEENFASSKDIRNLKYGKEGILYRGISRILGKEKVFAPTYICQDGIEFDPVILDLPNDVYLEGYWQSEKYFTDIAEKIRQEFTIKTPPVDKDKELGESISSCDAVNLHIRRGSYLLPPYNEVHGTSSLDYYYQCVSLICEEVSNPHFFIFSDDPMWVRDNLKLPYMTTFVDHNGPDKDYEDLRLMTRCKHHILANSTFSWWGAWLSQRKGKMIFAPKNWFLDDKENTEDLIPPGWMRV